MMIHRKVTASRYVCMQCERLECQKRLREDVERKEDVEPAKKKGGEDCAEQSEDARGEKIFYANKSPFFRQSLFSQAVFLSPSSTSIPESEADADAELLNTATLFANPFAFL